MSKIDFKHAESTREGRIERATWIFKHADGMVNMGETMAYLQGKGCKDDEIMIAMTQAVVGL